VPPELPDDELLRAELIEFQRHDPLTAAAMFRKAARSGKPGLRAAALVRLGRSLRNAGRIQEALDAYSELACLGTTPVFGLPADLVAREARCSALETSGRSEELRREAVSLLHDLQSGRWRLTRNAYEFRADEARRWTGDGAGPQHPSEAMALSGAVGNLVEPWRESPEDSSGRRVYLVHSQPVLAVWNATRGRLAAMLAGPQYLSSLCLEAVADRRVRLALTDSEGQTIFGRLPEPVGRVAVRTAAVTRLPWTIHVAGADPTRREVRTSGSTGIGQGLPRRNPVARKQSQGPGPSASESVAQSQSAVAGHVLVSCLAASTDGDLD